MFKLLALSVLSLFLSMLLLMVSELSNMKQKVESGKSSPFECGFDPVVLHRKPFSIHFFFTCVVFLIFDVELLILFPWLLGKTQGLCSSSMGGFTLSALMLLFFFGLLMEWNTRGLEWSS